MAVFSKYAAVLEADGSPMTTTRAQDVFYRMYGDFNADLRVNATDTAKYNTTFGINYTNTINWLMLASSTALPPCR